MELSERQKQLLSAIVERYIATGEPVGSKTLVDAAVLPVSSATVRNEMAALTAAGLLEQPHTSAGRIPSSAGYRYYVDHLMQPCGLSLVEKQILAARLRTASGDARQVLETAGQLLSELTHCAAVSTTPSDADAVVRRVELVPIGARTAMVVVLTSSGILKSRVCRTAAEITVDMAETFYNLVRENFLGKPAASLNIATIQTLAVSLGERALLMTPLLVTLSELAATTERTQLLLEGQSNLLGYRELAPNAFELMDFLRRPEPLDRMFSEAPHPADGEPVVVIGRENPYRELQNATLVFGRYAIAGHESGTLALLGPTRMDYARLIPSLQDLTEIVGKVLSDSVEE